MHIRLAVTLAITITALAGCDNKFATVPDDELADSMYSCRTEQDQSPGMAIRCDNVIRECKRRRDDGRYVC